MEKVKLTKEQKAVLTAWLDEADKNTNGSLLLPFEGSAIAKFCIVNGIPDLKTIRPNVNGKPFVINLITMDLTDSEDRAFKGIGCNYNKSMREVILSPELYDKPFASEVTKVKSQAGNLYSRVVVGEVVEE
jgi:hypothetical protein